MSSDLGPIWVKNTLGLVFGPLTQPVFENMVKSGAISAPYEVSRDGVVFHRTEAGGGAPKGRVEAPPVVREVPADDGARPSVQSPASWPARSNQAAPGSGRLEEWSPLRLYYVIAAAEAAGKLVLGEGSAAVAIGFKQGTPHAVSSESYGLSAFLVEQGVIQPAQLEAALPALEKAKDEIGGLMATGLLKPNDAFNWIQQHATFLLQRGLMLARGPFSYDPNAPLSAAGFPLGNRWQILIAAARKLDRTSLRQRLSGHDAQAPKLAGSTSELQLTAQETRLLAQFEGTRTLAALASAAPQDADSLYRLVFLLNELDRLDWETPDDRAAPPPAAASVAPPGAPKSAVPAPTPTPPAAATPTKNANPIPVKPPSAAPAAAVSAPARVTGPLPEPPVKVDELRALLASLQGKNHFDRLGVVRSTGMPKDLKKIYFDLAKRYHPDTLPSEAPLPVRKLREDVLAHLNEAYRVLSNDGSREKYIQQLEMVESGAVDLNLEAILQAEEEFRVAMTLFKARRYADALAKLDACIQMNGEEGEFYAWRGYAKFLTSTDKKAAYPEALGDVQTALRLSPKCAIAHVYSGHMAKLLDDPAAAKKAYRKALDLDSKQVEAERELRLMEQRALKKK